MLKPLAALLLVPLLVAVCSAAPVKGDRAPDVTGVTSNGAPLALADYSGKVVVLDFFATWCASCRQLTPLLVDLGKRYKLKVIGLDVDATGKDKLDTYIREKGITYPVAAASDKVQRDYGVRALPMVYVIGRDGRIAASFTGFNRQIAATLEALVKSLQ